MGLRRSYLWTALLAIGLMPAPGMTSHAEAAPRKGAPAKKEAPPKARKRPPGVRGMFEAAQELYDAGKYVQALTAYDMLLKKYPGHEPAIIQTAKTLYRLDRIKDAYAVFARVSPQHLDPETSYEYGWSFYTNKAWEGAFYAFQRVPKGHALYDLANYYGAICAIKLRRYEEAEDMLEKAVVLPDKLAKSRSLYIKHVQALRLMQQKSALAKERDKEKDALNEGDKKKTAKTTEPPVDDGTYTHAGFKSITRSAKIKYDTIHQYIDHHGLKESNFDARVSTFEMKSGFIWPLGSKTKERRTAFGLGITLAAEDRIIKGEEQQIVVSEDDKDLQRALISDLGTTDVKSGIAAAEPWIEFPLPENLWLALGGEINYTFVDFERANRTGHRKGYGEVNGTADRLTFGGSATYKEFLDTETKPISNVVESIVYVEREIIEQLTGKLKLTHSVFDYIDEDLSGADSATEAAMYLTQLMPLGFKLKAGAGYLTQTNYIFHGIPTYGQVSADGQTMLGRLAIVAEPFPFLTASVSQLFNKTNWTIDNEDATDAFEVTVPDYIEEFTATVSLNMAF